MANQIQNLFDSYAEDLAPQPQLAEKARARMTSARPKTATKIWRPILAVCCVLIFIVVLSNAVGNLLYPGYSEDPTESPSAFSYYTAKNVKGRVMDNAAAAQILPLENFNGTDYNIISEKYYAYYFKNGDELAYIYAVLGVSTEHGVVELTLIAENGSYIREDFAEQFNYYQNSGADLLINGKYGEGRAEYVTSACFAAHDMHFYVTAKSNLENQSDATKIVKLFL